MAFYAVGEDPTEPLERLEDYRLQQDYPWPVAEAGPGMLAYLRVLVQATKIAFDRQGIITYRDGYGGGGEETWRQVFDDLVRGP